MRNLLAFVSSLALCMGVLSLCGQSRIVPVDGSPGATGPAGPQGPAGDAGATGPTGPAGNATQATTGSPFGTVNCTCQAVYDSHGVPITEVRDSGVRCPHLDGTLQVCATGQIAVLAGGDGGGDLGILAEPQRTNVATETEDFDDPAWPRYGTIALGATDAVAGPPLDGGYSLAERLDFTRPADGGWGMTQETLPNAGNRIASVFLKGHTTSGQIYIWQTDGADYTSTLCSFTSTNWSRCSVYRSASSILFGIGNDQRATDQADIPSVNLYVWGAQAETGTDMTTYIPVAGGTALTRAQSRASMPLLLGDSTISIAATIIPNGTVADRALFSVAGVLTAWGDGEALRCELDPGGTPLNATAPGTLVQGAPNRVSCSYNGTVVTACLAGACNTTAGTRTLVRGASTFFFGTEINGGSGFNGVIKNTCVSGNAGACI